MTTLEHFNFENKKALIRVDFNVPLDENFKVTDTTRIEAAKATILKILEDGGAAILMSHLGDRKKYFKYKAQNEDRTASRLGSKRNPGDATGLTGFEAR